MNQTCAGKMATSAALEQVEVLRAHVDASERDLLELERRPVVPDQRVGGSKVSWAVQVNRESCVGTIL